jgi:FKBP-type peptidyl-prolyl cis-trans isomerase
MWLQRMLSKGWLLVLIVGAAMVLQGCLKQESVYDPNQFFEADMETIRNHIVANNLDVQFDTTNSIYYQIHNQGTGYKTIRGREVDLHYQGETLDGSEFVNSFDGVPERIYLGMTRENSSANPASYVWGLDDWLLLMSREGDSITVFLPSAYAFQDVGYSVVGPNEPVKYLVKFEDILLLSEEHEKIDQYIADKNWSSEIESTYGTRTVVHTAGDPDVGIDFGDLISINYQGMLLDDTIFDSNFGEHAWNFTLGEQSLIVGFELGLNELNDQDSATFFVPSIYGYGKDGSPPTIPANAPLGFTIKVLDVSKS